MLKLFWRLARAGRTGALWLANLPREAARALGGLEGERGHRHRTLGRALLAILPIAALVATLMPRIVLVMSPSIDAWAVRAAPGAIGKGDLVMFSLRHPIAGPRAVKVTKYVLCVAGERLTILETPSGKAPHESDARYFCNGALLGTTLPYSARGVRLTRLRWSGIIPVGRAYVGSHHPRGFDSRYFGLVRIDRLVRMERLL